MTVLSSGVFNSCFQRSYKELCHVALCFLLCKNWTAASQQGLVGLNRMPEQARLAQSIRFPPHVHSVVCHTCTSTTERSSRHRPARKLRTLHAGCGLGPEAWFGSALCAKPCWLAACFPDCWLGFLDLCIRRTPGQLWLHLAELLDVLCHLQQHKWTQQQLNICRQPKHCECCYYCCRLNASSLGLPAAAACQARAIRQAAQAEQRGAA